MNFFKEIIIIIVITIIVFSANIITKKITEESVYEVKNIVLDIEENIYSEEDEINKKLEHIEYVWKDKNSKLSLFIEHDELENISSELVLIKSNIKNDLKEEALANISQVKFLLNHIENKYKFKLNNIF